MAIEAMGKMSIKANNIATYIGHLPNELVAAVPGRATGRSA
jgi:hypothetical protein